MQTFQAANLNNWRVHKPAAARSGVIGSLEIAMRFRMFKLKMTLTREGVRDVGKSDSD